MIFYFIFFSLIPVFFHSVIYSESKGTESCFEGRSVRWRWKKCCKLESQIELKKVISYQNKIFFFPFFPSSKSVTISFWISSFNVSLSNKKDPEYLLQWTHYFQNSFKVRSNHFDHVTMIAENLEILASQHIFQIRLFFYSLWFNANKYYHNIWIKFQWNILIW